MGSIPATPSTKHASCFPPSSLPASIEISIKLVVCLSGWWQQEPEVKGKTTMIYNRTKGEHIIVH
jgi:hypothetical protein